MTRLQSTIKLLALLQAGIFVLWLADYTLFINFEVAFLSALLILLGSMYSYSRLVQARTAVYEAMDEKELIDAIDDPYDLYDDETPEDSARREAAGAETIKEVIQEEKARFRGQGAKNLQKSAPAVVSFYRLIPYGFLILGFIGLQNNGMLSLWPYLTGLAAGIAAGFFSGKRLFTSES